MHIRSLLPIIGGIAGALAMALPAGAATSPHSSNGAVIARQILNAPNPDAAYNALPAAQKLEFGIAEKPVSVSVHIVHVRTIRPNALSPDWSGCWSTYVLLDWKAAAGNTVYTTWQGLDWCSSVDHGLHVAWYHTYVRGGETSTPGWSFNGDYGEGSRNVGWEIRKYTEEKFTFSVGVYSFSQTPCTQIRGGDTGLYSWQGSCNLN